MSASGVLAGATEETGCLRLSVDKWTVIVLCPNLGKRGSVLRYPQFGGIGEEETGYVLETSSVGIRVEEAQRFWGGDRGDGDGAFSAGFRIEELEFWLGPLVWI